MTNQASTPPHKPATVLMIGLPSSRAFERPVQFPLALAQLDRGTVPEATRRAGGQRIGSQAGRFGGCPALLRQVRQADERERLRGGIDLPDRLGALAHAQLVERRQVAAQRFLVRCVAAVEAL